MEKGERNSYTQAMLWLLALLIVSWVSIVFIGGVFEIIGWITAGLVGLTAYHISKRNKDEKEVKNG